MELLGRLNTGSLVTQPAAAEEEEEYEVEYELEYEDEDEEESEAAAAANFASPSPQTTSQNSIPPAPKKVQDLDGVG